MWYQPNLKDWERACAAASSKQSLRYVSFPSKQNRLSLPLPLPSLFSLSLSLELSISLYLSSLFFLSHYFTLTHLIHQSHSIFLVFLVVCVWFSVYRCSCSIKREDVRIANFCTCKAITKKCKKYDITLCLFAVYYCVCLRLFLSSYTYLIVTTIYLSIYVCFRAHTYIHTYITYIQTHTHAYYNHLSLLSKQLTTSYYEGVVAMIEPEGSWVAKWQKIGVYKYIHTHTHTLFVYIYTDGQTDMVCVLFLLPAYPACVCVCVCVFSQIC